VDVAELVRQPEIAVPPGHSLGELRNEAIACLLLPDFEVAREWDGWPIGSSGLAFDATFERYARGDRNANVSIRRVSDDRELLTLPGVGVLADPRRLTFSPDGRFLDQRFQTLEGGHSRLWQLDSPRPRCLLDDTHTDAAFRPDGRQWAACYSDGTLSVFDTASGKVSRWRVGATAVAGGFSISWNPRRPLLLMFGGRRLLVIDARTGRVD
jgi:WD40 repeat protein